MKKNHSINSRYFLNVYLIEESKYFRKKTFKFQMNFFQSFKKVEINHFELPSSYQNLSNSDLVPEIIEFRSSSRNPRCRSPAPRRAPATSSRTSSMQRGRGRTRPSESQTPTRNQGNCTQKPR